jgi:hypothetical protein
MVKVSLCTVQSGLGDGVAVDQRNLDLLAADVERRGFDVFLKRN